MASFASRQASAETILDRLAKRPILLIILTASVSFGVQQIPFSTIMSGLKVFCDASMAYQFKFSNLKESLQQFFKPSVLLAFVCSGILFIVYTSHHDKGEYRAEDHSPNPAEPRRGILTRTATLGQTLFSQLIPHTDEAHLYLAKQDSGPFDHETAKDARSFLSSKQEDGEKASMLSSDVFVSSSSAETRTAKSRTNEGLKTSARAAGSKIKLSRPKTSTDLSNRDRPIVDPKLSHFPRSFRDDPTQLDKEELKGRFEAYLGNVRHQLQLQKQESLLAKQLDLELKEVKRDSGQTVEASPIVAFGLLNDGEMSPKSRASATLETANDLTEEQVRERTDAFLASLERGSKPARGETRSGHQLKHHSKSYSYSLGSPAKAPVESARKDASTLELLHSTSDKLIRRDSLAKDNQKFESFLQKVRNDLKLQKQESNLQKHLVKNEY